MGEPCVDWRLNGVGDLFLLLDSSLFLLCWFFWLALELRSLFSFELAWEESFMCTFRFTDDLPARCADSSRLSWLEFVFVDFLCCDAAAEPLLLKEDFLAAG